MSTLTLLSSVFVYLGAFIGLFFVLKSAMSTYYFKQKRKEIEVLVSKSSMLKLRLKTRATKKCNEIADSLKNNPLLFEILRPKLTEITTLNFGTEADFNLLVNNLVFINQNILLHGKLTMGKKSESDDGTVVPLPQTLIVDSVKDHYMSLYKNDRVNILIIFEIIDIHKELEIKLEEYNKFTKFDRSQRKMKVDVLKIEFENMFVLNDLVKSDREFLAQNKRTPKPETVSLKAV